MRDERDNLDVVLEEAVSLAQHLPTLPWPGPEEPEDELLLRYLDGELAPRERERVRQELARSPYFSERLITLRESLEEVRSPEPASAREGEETGRARRGDARLRLSFLWAANGLRFLWGSLAPRCLVAVPLATRGAAVPSQEESAFFDFSHRFEDVGVLIQLERVPGGRLDLQLQLQAPPRDVGPLRVNLRDRRGALLDSQPVERGVARFISLVPATHQLSITTPKGELGQVLLDIHFDQPSE